METFAEKLKRLRSDKSLSQLQLAEKIYVSRSAVAKWEQGRGFPSVDSLQLIAAEFCVTIDDLVSDKEVEILKIQKDKKLSLRTKLLIATSVILAVVIAIGATLAVMYYPRKLSKYLNVEVAKVDAVYLEYYRYKENGGYETEQVRVFLEQDKINFFIDYAKKIEVIPRYQAIKTAALYSFTVVCGNTEYDFSFLGLSIYVNGERVKRYMYDVRSGEISYLLILFVFDINDMYYELQ